MPLSVLDLYKDVLPKTNCGNCGFPTCMAFAGMVVSEKHPIGNCPHLLPETVSACEKELQTQYDAGKWLKKNPARDALQWARERSASMAIEDLQERIGGTLVRHGSQTALALPYFAGTILILPDRIIQQDGEELNMWEQVFIYNHLAQNGSALPSGHWKGFGEFPNTISKIKNMKAQVETPLADTFKGRVDMLLVAARILGGRDMTAETGSADAAILFAPLPRVPVMLMFWDAEEAEGFAAEARLLFDKTVTEHLDIESILFLSERLCQLLCGTNDS
ncbi:DUF3786 domain-containing protein [Desulfosudis oleivorans]|uniref:Fe-S cluster domain protein n=1 Tax=Desulfosudis oleivorans (strain DSM 6200 / JCM 39069 / Hxd3) TaxID=96561 RepID=A8ZZT9_DESOH|nr:DUF3786 domain-containing protein [Desulfosudis oleivorans]ABW67339.1 Fe-S cluster domain protein [Desulfosudis oleivorans Hxd3]